MQIERIHDKYDQRGQMYDARKPVRPRQKPIPAVMFDNVDLSGDKSASDEKALLLSYIKSIPEEEVKERMRNLRDSYEDIDDGLIDRLLIEEL